MTGVQTCALPILPHAGKKAIDLGCGAGTECGLLLQAGWQVYAIDREPASIERVKAIGQSLEGGRLTAEVLRFEDVEHLPVSSLIYAGFALPFCDPEYFPRLWQAVLQALEAGGLFAGHLFGERDEWSIHPDMTFHSESDARRLFAGLNIVQFHEFDGVGPSMGGPKRWHRFEIVAQNPEPSGD